MAQNVLNAIQARPAIVQGVVVPPLTPSNSNVLRFISSVAAASQALPRPQTTIPVVGVQPVTDWRGRDVEIINEGTTAGDILFVAFSRGAAVVLVNTAAGATGAPTATRGEPILPGTRVRRAIPRASDRQVGATGEDVFVNWIAAANTPVLSMVLVEHER